MRTSFLAPALGLTLVLACVPATATAGDAAPAAAAAPLPDHPPPTADVLAIPPGLRDAFRHAVLDRTGSPAVRLERMSAFLFDPVDGLGMTYDGDATHTVTESWRTRRANCLGFTLLTVALAREAGLEAHANRFDEVLTWRVEQAHLIRSNHVNTSIATHRGRYTFDVARDLIVTGRHPPVAIQDHQLLALYFGNRAMELVIAGQPAAATAFVERSLALDPRSADGLNNAGVAAMRNGDDGSAGAYYRAALAANRNHWSALANLIALYERAGDEARANALRERAARLGGRDPFHHFLAGLSAEGSGAWDDAARRYRKAIRLHPGEHRFHSALARALLHLGEPREAGRSLQRAHALADADGRARYQAKLDRLKSRRTH